MFFSSETAAADALQNIMTSYGAPLDYVSKRLFSQAYVTTNKA